MTEVRRVAKRAVKKTAVPSVKQPPQEDKSPWAGEDLDVGDRLEYGATVEVKSKRGLSYWPKASAAITIREGETVEQAKARVSNIVDQFLADAVEDFMSD